MSRVRNKAFMAVLVSAISAFVIWSAYCTFIAGRTSGPDFISAIQSGSVSFNSISSIELVEPTVGYMPFTEREYDSLPRRAKIDAPATINRLLTLLQNCQPGMTSQNHPNYTFRVYLKVNCQNGFYWVYCDVWKDDQSAKLKLDANNRNAVNPNGASAYHLDDFTEVLAILQQGDKAGPNGAVEKNQK